MTTATVGIIGASGYSGAELLRLAAQHPEFSVEFATANTHAGTPISELYPHLAGAYPHTHFVPWERVLAEYVDLVFVALPYPASQTIVGDLLELRRPPTIIDLGSDFRLTDPAAYPRWYNHTHTRPDLLGEFTYGLTELYRTQITNSTLIAQPGCSATAAILATGPLHQLGLTDRTQPAIINVATGLSGGGRGAKPVNTFCAADHNATAYRLDGHEHTPEMETHIGGPVLFVPHRVPMSRGILATCYTRPAHRHLDTDTVLAELTEFYTDAPFVTVTDTSPGTKNTLGSNSAHLTARVDPRTNTIVTICALDNLGKGAAGAAIQNANLTAGLDETTGLALTGLYP